MAMKTMTVYLIASLALPIAAIAAAPSQIDELSVTVSYGDLNIDNVDGARILYSRLRRAAEEVCEIDSHVGYRSLSANARAKRKCYLETLDRAVAEIDHEQVTRIHES